MMRRMEMMAIDDDDENRLIGGDDQVMMREREIRRYENIILYFFSGEFDCFLFCLAIGFKSTTGNATSTSERAGNGGGAAFIRGR